MLKMFLAEIFSHFFELRNFIILNNICIDVVKTYSLQKRVSKFMRKRFNDIISRSQMHKTFLAEIFSRFFEIENFIIVKNICMDVVKTYSLQTE